MAKQREDNLLLLPVQTNQNLIFQEIVNQFPFKMLRSSIYKIWSLSICVES